MGVSPVTATLWKGSIKRLWRGQKAGEWLEREQRNADLSTILFSPESGWVFLFIVSSARHG